MKDPKFTELASLFFAMHQIVKQQLPPKGTSDPNMWLRMVTLRFIAEAGDPTMQDVAKHLRIKAPSATSLVAHLAKGGFVSRRGEKDDKRVVRIFLTARGRREVKKYVDRSTVMIRNAFSRLDDQELQDLVEILRHLRDAHQE